MKRRLTSGDVAEAVPALLAVVSREHAGGRLSDGEYHLFRDHLFSRDLHAIRRVNQQLLEASSRAAAPEPQVARLAQQPRDPATNRSSFGSIVVFLVEAAATPPGRGGEPAAAPSRVAQRQLHGSLQRAVNVLQTSFGDRLASLTFESVVEAPSAPPALPPAVSLARQRSEERRSGGGGARGGVARSGMNRSGQQAGGTSPAVQMPKMVLSKDGEWVYPETTQSQKPPDAREREREKGSGEDPLGETKEKREGGAQRKERRQRRRRAAGDPVAAQLVAGIDLKGFSVAYRVTTDSEGNTVGGGVGQDRKILALTLEQPVLTGHGEQRLIKAFAGCLN